MMFLFVFQRGILDILELNKLGDGPFWVNNNVFLLCYATIAYGSPVAFIGQIARMSIVKLLR